LLSSSVGNDNRIKVERLSFKLFSGFEDMEKEIINSNNFLLEELLNIKFK